MADLTFYTNPMSRGQTVRWMLEEVGQPYDTEILDYATTMKAEPYLSINPMGKVPAIRHNGRVVTEVAAICCYLADAFPEANLAPPPADRADYYRWIFFTSGPIEAAFSNKAAGWEPTPERQRMFDLARRPWTPTRRWCRRAWWRQRGRTARSSSTASDQASGV